MGVELRFPNRPDWDWLRLRYCGMNLLHCDADLLAVSRVMRGRWGYLATPFTGPVVQGGRYRSAHADVLASEAAHWALWGAVNRMTLISPVVNSMAMLAQDLGGTCDPLDRDFWQSWCLPLLNGCGGVVVPPMAGWDRSDGVWRACCHALRHNTRVFLLRADLSALAAPELVEAG